MGDLKVYRAENGQLVVSLNNVNDKELGSVGTVSGNLELRVGTTEGSSDETVLMIAQNTEETLDFKAEDSFNNYEFSGKNIDADFNTTGTKPYSVSMNTTDSTFDSSKCTKGVVLSTTADSSNNYIKLGTSTSNLLSETTADGKTVSFQNYVVDAGSKNTIDSTSGGATLFETEATSNGVIIDAGNSANMFILAGDNGVFSGGSGTDYFATQSGANNNVMLGNAGSDVLYESGSSNLFVGGTGYDSATMQGHNSIANLGFNETGYASYGNGSYQSTIFTGESATDSLGNVHKYAQIMKANGWTLEQFLEKSGIEENPNYASIKAELEKVFKY